MIKPKRGLCIEKFVITGKLSRCWRYGPNTLAMSNYIVVTPAQAFRYDQDLPLFLQQVDSRHAPTVLDSAAVHHQGRL